MSMMPGSSRDRILELERASAVLKGALEAATEQNNSLRGSLDEWKADHATLQAENDRLRDERDRYRDALETCRDAAAVLQEAM